MRLIAIRHGETEWNTQDREMGQLDSPLTSRGVRQAHAIAHRLSRVPFGALYSSDLGRAVATAGVIGERCGKQVRIAPGLRERHMGIFQGLTVAEMRERFPRERQDYERVGFEYSNGRWSLEVWNDIGHLDGVETLDDPTIQTT